MRTNRARRLRVLCEAEQLLRSRVLCLLLLLLLLSEAEQLSLGSASAAKVRRRRNKRGLQEAEQLSLGSASAAKVRRRRTRRGLQEAEQTRACRAIATQIAGTEPELAATLPVQARSGNPEGVQRSKVRERSRACSRSEQAEQAPRPVGSHAKCVRKRN